MTAKGQITIPAQIRDFLSLEAGDIVDFYADERSGVVEIVARNRPVADLFGMLNDAVAEGSSPATSTEIDEAIGSYLAANDERIAREWRERREFEAWRRARDPEAAK
jgi:AbrB family looped-hinge helix DNA binding protein